jgi:hypothetical protein
MVNDGVENRRFHGQRQCGSCTGRPDRPQLPIEPGPIIDAVIRVDSVVLAEEQTDGLRPELPQFLDVRFDHGVALQAPLAECQSRHVPSAVGSREVHLQANGIGRDQRRGQQNRG